MDKKTTQKKLIEQLQEQIKELQEKVKELEAKPSIVINNQPPVAPYIYPYIAPYTPPVYLPPYEIWCESDGTGTISF